MSSASFRPRILAAAVLVAAAAIVTACKSDLLLPADSATLTVAGGGSGSGLVSAVPASGPKLQCPIVGGSADANACRGIYAAGTAVSLDAAPAAGNRFGGWTGACSGLAACTMTLADSAMVTAMFEVTQYSLIVVGAGTGGGTVKSGTGTSPAINCAITAGQTSATGCTGAFMLTANRLTLTASANSRSSFSGWGGDCSGTSSCQVSLDRDRVVSAAFVSRHGGSTSGE